MIGKILTILVCCLAVGLPASELPEKKPRLRVVSEDGNISMRFDVRMQIDGAVFFENKNEDILSDGVDLRRARLSMKTNLYKDWNAEWDIDMAVYMKEDDKKDKGPMVRDMWLAYDGFENLSIKAGEFKPPFSLEEMISSLQQSSPERSIANVFTPGRRCGLGVTHWGSFYNVSAGAFSESVNNLDKKFMDEGTLLAARGALHHELCDGILIHGGASGYLATPEAVQNGDERWVEYDVQPETEVTRVQFIDSDKIFNVREITAYGLEGAFQFRSVLLRAEYIETELDRKEHYEAAAFCGGYVAGSWFLTGEREIYEPDTAEFHKPVPKCHAGAVEIVARYSYIDLSDTDAMILGGKAAIWSAGVNWYPNPNICLMLHGAMVDNSLFADGEDAYIGDDDFEYIATRIQVGF